MSFLNDFLKLKLIMSNSPPACRQPLSVFLGHSLPAWIGEGPRVLRSIVGGVGGHKSWCPDAHSHGEAQAPVYEIPSGLAAVLLPVGRLEAPVPHPVFLGHQQPLSVMSCYFLRLSRWVTCGCLFSDHPFGPAGLSSSSPLTHPKATPNSLTKALEHILIRGVRQRERMGKKSVICYRQHWLSDIREPEGPAPY